ncbi:unnamed protein product, partial [Allacma fusca]
DILKLLQASVALPK